MPFIYDFVISDNARLSGNDLEFPKVVQQLCDRGVKPEDIVTAWNASHKEFENKMYLVKTKREKQ